MAELHDEPGDTSLRATRRAYVALLARYLRPQWRRAALMALVLVASIALDLLGPQLLRVFVDAAQASGPLDGLTRTALLFLAAAVGARLVAGLAGYLSEDVGWTATNRLRSDLALHCLSLDLSFHHAHTPGELIERVDGDVSVLARVFSRFVVDILGSGLLLAGILALSVATDPWIGGALALYTAVGLVVIQRAQRMAGPAFTASRQATADMSGFFGEMLEGLEDVRANGATAYIMRRYLRVQRLVNRARMRVQQMVCVIGGAITLVTTVATALVLALGAVALAQGAITLGTLMLLYSYTLLLVRHLLAINEQLGEWQQATASFARIAELFATRSRVRDGPGVRWAGGPPAISFADVTFGYARDRPVLSGLSLRVEPGEVAGIVGRTGSGKTTLARLLFRFYDPDAGAVLLDGQDVRRAAIAHLQGRIGFVPQDVRVLGASVRDNLTLFHSGYVDHKLLDVIARLGLDAWLARLPRGLDTVLAPGAVSAGEAQLLALARVFLRDPEVIVLDEASSRLDPATERLVRRAIRELLVNRTGLIIAHRLATLEHVDRILVLDEGRIVEQGPPAALARAPGSRYAALVRAAGAEGVLA